MNEERSPSFFGKLKRMFQVLVFGAAGAPTNPAQVPLVGDAPQGLVLLHSTPTVSEADVLRQVLHEAGFHIEYVASPHTGVFGTSGNSSIFVRADEYEQAAEFLKEYLAAEPLPEDEEER